MIMPRVIIWHYKYSMNETYFEEKNGLKLLRHEILRQYEGIACAVSTRYRSVPVSREAPEGRINYDIALSSYSGNLEQREKILEPMKLALGLKPGISSGAYMQQMHTANIAVIKHGGCLNLNTDGMVTDRPGIGLLALSADCGMTCFYDRSAHAVAIMHSGWRGAFQNIYSAALNAMRLNYGTHAENIVACAAPMISASNYEVKDDFISLLKLFYPGDFEKFLLHQDEKVFFDLRSLLLFQLSDLGIRDVSFAPQCTYNEASLFPSYRRDGNRGRSFHGHFGMMAALK